MGGTDSAWKRKKKETNALNKDLRRTRVRSLERFKDSPEVENSHSGILFIPMGVIGHLKLYPKSEKDLESVK
jgi:hypothetical protein